MNTDLIQPRTLKGFRDYLPEAMLPREALMETARRVYRSYGYSPIDTPALEHLEILTGKGGEESDRQLYQFQDDGGRMVGMRFDLTVPLARFVAQHVQQLGLPFKRFHIGTVWRGEKPQAGRFREFIQCDFDTIGTSSIAADIETALVIHDLLAEIGFRRFTIAINHRKLLNGLLQKIGLARHAPQVLRAIDKREKIGAQAVIAEIGAIAGKSAQVEEVFSRLFAAQGPGQEVLDSLADMVQGSNDAEFGLQQLGQIHQTLSDVGMDTRRFRIDVSIARGLDYYTGTVFETTLDDLPEIGSVCSGGRYDNLAGLFTRQQLPGVGASLGLDRLLAAMQQLQMLQPVRTPAQVLIIYFDASRLAEYLRIARRLRTAGIGVEVYPEPKKLDKQLKYADQRGFQAAIVAGSSEFEKRQVQIKWLAERSQTQVPLTDSAAEIVEQLTAKLGN